ncbi:MAG: hypothetical protein H6Q66_2000 [Firmicutes bacterium]|nr:hypothetical protein [Bacillota bacterium]
MEEVIQDKPLLLKAVEMIVSNPADIKKQVIAMENQYYEKYGGKKSKDQIQALMCEHIIKNYSYFTAFSGGVTALAGIVPGLGTLVSTLGGGTADAALCMKWQIEMVMAIASIYGRDITNEEEKMICFMVAGLGAINEFGKNGFKNIGNKAFCNMIKQYLSGTTLQGVKQIFKQVGITFTQKAALKAAPFGISVIISSGANKLLTKYVGSKAIAFYNPIGSCYENDIVTESDEGDFEASMA